MVHIVGQAAFWLQLSTLLNPTIADVAEKNTDLNANGALADLITVRASYFRALCDANPVSWDQALADKAKEKVDLCDLEYDYWSPEGQTIFRMVGENNQIVNSPNATNFALQHWYDMRVNYSGIASDEYDELQPFYPAWEFSQMVWKTNTKVGCAYAVAANCPDLDASPNDQMYQLYCLFTPGGNKWDQWGANVECKDCKDVQPQLSTVNTATLTFSDVKRAAVRAAVTPSTTYEPPNDLVKMSLKIAMTRVDRYLTMNNTEFMSRWDMAENGPSPTVTTPAP